MQLLCISPWQPQLHVTVMNALFRPPRSLCIQCCANRGSCDGVPHWVLNSKNVIFFFSSKERFCSRSPPKRKTIWTTVQTLFCLNSCCFLLVFLFVEVMSHECHAGFELTTWLLISMCFGQLSHQGTSVYLCLRGGS